MKTIILAAMTAATLITGNSVAAEKDTKSKCCCKSCVCEKCACTCGEKCSDSCEKSCCKK